MKKRFNHKDTRRNEHDNRLKIVMAVIFLLALALIAKLFSLQVLKYDLYFALASDQQQVYNKLEPERGKILVQDGREILGDKTYPIAFNKDFAQVYAVPDKIENPEDVAEKLYEIFDKEKMEKEIRESIEKEMQKDEVAEEKEDNSKKELNPLGTDEAALKEYTEIKITLALEEDKKRR